MEASPNGMDNGNGNVPPTEPWINLQNFIVELCQLTQIPTTGINILSQSVGQKILQFLRDSQSKLSRFEGLMKSLSDIADVSTDGVDVCGQKFVKSVLDNVRQDLGLVKIIRNHSLTRGEGNRETQPPPSAPAASRSNGHNSFSESSELARNENNALHHEMDSVSEDVKVLLEVSQIISISTSSIPRPSPEVNSPTVAPNQSSTLAPSLVISATDHASTEACGNNCDSVNVTVLPTLPTTFAEDGHQSAPPPLEDLGQSQSKNEADVGTGLGVVNEITQTQLPSTSRQLFSRQPYTTINVKKRKPRISMRKIHFGYRWADGSYRCYCNSQFSSIITLKNHLNFFNSVWKFKCTQCPEKFYILSNLKMHLKNDHGLVNPLKDYKIGCTLRGSMFKTRRELGNHKKTEHNVHQICELVPRLPTLTNPMLVSIEHQQRSEHHPPLRQEDSNRNDVIELDNNEIIDLISEDEEDKQIESVVGADVSMNQGNPPPPPLQMDHQPQNSGLMNGIQRNSKNCCGETSTGLNKQNGHNDFYECIMCTQAFRDLEQLRSHLTEGHQSN